MVGGEKRTLGKLTPGEAIEVVSRGYKSGPSKILAVDINGPTANCLLVEMPSSRLKRSRVLKWSNDLARCSGFTPDTDWGQNVLFVYVH